MNEVTPSIANRTAIGDGGVSPPILKLKESEMNNVVNFKPKPTTIEVELVETHFFTRWPCTVCGGCTEKVAILAEGRQSLSNDGESRLVRVCEYCLQAGEIDARLELHARQIEAEAALLRDMIGRLQVPTYAEYLAYTEQHQVGWRDAYEKETGEKIEEIEVRPGGDELTDDLPF